MKHRVQRIGCLLVVGLLLLCVATVGVSALTNLSLPARSSMTETLSPLDKARLDEAIHLRSALGDKVWQGWGTHDTPVIIYNEEYAFLVGYPDPPDGWVKMPQGEMRGGLWEAVQGDIFDGQPYYRQPLPAPNITPENFTVLVGERWAATMQAKEFMEIDFYNGFRQELPAVVQPLFPYRLMWGLLMGSTENYIGGLEHEAFHALQGSLVPEKLAQAEFANREEAGYPWDDPDMGASWKKELDLLVQGVRAKSSEETAELARQFLAQRDQRRLDAGLTQAQVDYERQREWLEGLAKYAELQLCLAASTNAGYSPVSGIVEDPDFKDYANQENYFASQVNEIRLSGDRDDETRFYYGGMAQAVLLDSLLPGWKDRAFEPDVMLEDLLREAIGGSR